ncbi:hypothetical protein IMG5_190690 [Ichthyophthirius multifiliis]|uniref:Transmembrane protein n=1 Tax=Ichthyophthirius multifiliis TaxID=5932 RepID=G0R4A2_ICHMU|nr:hypothetical protein IMG5_190690 [Ichthyophthirius multifiliis]EGR27713.1 hypothetical protein IMG5_190690 [Ichthyophthirius multifiliis]|eukprot:XP_004025165.1 hypothetical protein IMG5_190690 [Ichthyophthirius multifiliis]
MIDFMCFCFQNDLQHIYFLFYFLLIFINAVAQFKYFNKLNFDYLGYYFQENILYFKIQVPKDSMFLNYLYNFQFNQKIQNYFNLFLFLFFIIQIKMKCTLGYYILH